MKYWALLTCFVLLSRPSLASDTSPASNEELINGLINLDSETPGADQAATFDGFMAGEGAPKFNGGLLGVTPPRVPVAMRELVGRGLSALPDLLDHLSDPRPTKLIVGGSGFFMWRAYGSEYDAGPSSNRRYRCQNDCSKDFDSRMFDGPYTVKVGDICFVLVGQIVDRKLIAVRYQATAGLIVNSPIVTPWLATQTRKDWRGLTPSALKASLLADLSRAQTDDQKKAASERLAFYFPK